MQSFINFDADADHISVATYSNPNGYLNFDIEGLIDDIKAEKHSSFSFKDSEIDDILHCLTDGTWSDDQESVCAAVVSALRNAFRIHGNTGNSNAAKDDKSDSHLHMRVKSSEKAAWVKAAGGKLAPWVVKTLNNAAKNSQID